jgi:hypothetical protein
MIAAIGDFIAKVASASSSRHSGWCGFDGFIDNFVGCKPRFDGRIWPQGRCRRGLLYLISGRHLGEKFGGNAQLTQILNSQLVLNENNHTKSI